MDQVLNESGKIAETRGRLGVADQAVWERYYREASKRRRERGGLKENFQQEKRRRRRREYLGLAISSLLVGALTLLFYAVLSR